jgi:hypothetical protein
MKCQARLRRRLASNTPWPEELSEPCGQVVGVSRWWDVLNIERAACSLPGHREDVEAQSRAAEIAERVRHEVERDARPICNDFRELQQIRPEMRGVYR